MPEQPDPQAGRPSALLGPRWLWLAVAGLIVLGLVTAYRANMRALVTDPSVSTLQGFTVLAEPRTLPALAFKDAGGRKLSLADFRGKLVLLNIWATWCPPCRKEMPSLDRLQARLGGRDFEVVALSIDTGGADLVRSFYDEIGLRGLQLYIDEDGEALSALGIAGVPTTLLVDRQGREVGRKTGPAEWDSPAMIAFLERQIGVPENQVGDQ